MDEAGLKGAQQSNAEALAQAEQQVTTAKSTLATDQASLSSGQQSNTESLSQAQQQVATARQTLAMDQAGLKAPSSPTPRRSPRRSSRSRRPSRRSPPIRRACRAGSSPTLSPSPRPSSRSPPPGRRSRHGRGGPQERPAVQRRGARPGGAAGHDGQLDARFGPAHPQGRPGELTADQQKEAADCAGGGAAAGDGASRGFAFLGRLLQPLLRGQVPGRLGPGSHDDDTRTRSPPTRLQSPRPNRASASTKTKDSQTLQQVEAKVSADEAAVTLHEQGGGLDQDQGQPGRSSRASGQGLLSRRMPAVEAAATAGAVSGLDQDQG